MKHGTCDFIELDFKDKEIAEDFIKDLKSVIDKYEYATIADALDLYGATSYDYQSNDIRIPKFDRLLIETVYRVSIPYNFQKKYD